MATVICSHCGGQNRAGVKFCTRCGAALVASPPPTAAPVSPIPSPAPARTTISHVEGQAVIIGDNARQQISYYGDIIVRVDSLEELPPKPGEPPYKGLTYYTEADEAIFFGREQLSDDLAARLEATRFLAVAGASGSGKSSLLRAGVVPRLRRRNWLIHILTPTADPLTQLANSLTHDDPALSAADALRGQLATDFQTLRRAAEKRVARAGAARLLLVVDQFEELFTQCHDEAGRRAFIDNLLAAARDAGNVTVLIGLQADFTGRLTEVEELRARVEQNFALLGPMQPEDLVRVIAEPARIGGWAFVSGLVEQFLSDVGQEPGRLPLLSHALLETWARRSGHVMTLKGYRAAGGVEGAIAKTAEDTLRRLDERTERPVMQAVFLALTELGEGSEDTRRIARRDELARAGEAAAVEAVLNTLAGARLVTVEQSGDVQVAHEALIRRWPRLREWLADNRERIRQQEALKQEQQSAGRFRRLSRWLAAAVAVAVIFGVVAAGLAVIARNAQAEVERLNRETRAGRRRTVALSTEAKNTLHAILHAHHLLPPAEVKDIFHPRERAWWDALPLSPVEMTRVQVALETLDFATRQRERYEAVLAQLAAGDERVPLLAQLPGIGLVAAMTLLGAIGDIERFPTATQLVGYAGLGAQVHDSGQTRWTGRITKAGRRDIRRVMVDAASHAVKMRGHWRDVYERLKPRLGRPKALVAIARKLLIAVWHVLTEATADRFATPEQVAAAFYALAYKVGVRNLPEGVGARQFVRDQLDRLGLGDEITHIPWGSKRFKLPPSRVEEAGD